ncbi:MAG: hypothetical protein WCO43_08825 [Chitinophagia bacterium]
MKRNSALFFHTFLIWTGLLCLVSCTTEVYLVSPEKLISKKIAVGNINLQTLSNKVSTDTLCTCIAGNVKNILKQYFIESGLTVVDLPTNKKIVEIDSLQTVIDSLGIDVIVSGNGIVYDHQSKKGKGIYININQLSLEYKDVRTSNIVATGYFSGVPFDPYGGAERLGKQFKKQLKKSSTKLK